MKTEYQIYLDYNQAMRQADKLDELAAELEQVGGTKLGEALGQVRANWSGENADAFLRKANVLTTQNGVRCVSSGGYTPICRWCRE